MEMPTFEEAWKATGYQYGEDELENVRLGWEMCMAEITIMFSKEHLRQSLANRGIDTEA